MYENDEAFMNFVKEFNEEFPPIIPRVLIQNKLDMISSQNQIIRPTAAFAHSMGIKIWKECSAKEQRIKDAVDGILITAIEPSKGLSDIGAENVRKFKGDTDFWSLSSSLPLIALLALLGTGVAALVMIQKGINPIKMITR